MSVKDVVNSANRDNGDWGIEGYSLPKFNAFLDKAPNFKIMKTRTRDVLGDMIKHKKDFPGPEKYETGLTMLLKRP